MGRPTKPKGETDGKAHSTLWSFNSFCLPLAYDLRKLRAHGLIERPDNRYVYALSDYGRKAAAMLVLVRTRILRPIAGSLFGRPPKFSLKPNSKLQAQYRRTTRSFNDLVALLKAA